MVQILALRPLSPCPLNRFHHAFQDESRGNAEEIHPPIDIEVCGDLFIRAAVIAPIELAITKTARTQTETMEFVGGVHGVCPPKGHDMSSDM